MVTGNVIVPSNHVQQTEYLKNISCPCMLDECGGNGTITENLSKMSEYGIKADSTEAVLNAITDGGQTDAYTWLMSSNGQQSRSIPNTRYAFTKNCRTLGNTGNWVQSGLGNTNDVLPRRQIDTGRLVGKPEGGETWGKVENGGPNKEEEPFRGNIWDPNR